MTNPILPPTALLHPVMPGVYSRSTIYDPTWTDPSYNAGGGQLIVPAVGSLVRDVDETPLWVIAINPVTYVPSYQAVPLSTDNDNVVSILNYGNTVLRLYIDYRALPYPVTPDSKCIFLGKSPRFYTLTRYPNTAQESVISQYFDQTGQLVSQMVPLVSLDGSNSSWYLPRSNVSVHLDDNEEVGVKIYGEDGTEVFSALLFTKQSAVINEDVIYSPTIVGMTVAGNQQLTDGTFYLFEKQDFGSLGLSATLVYDNGTTSTIPVDGTKCVLYGNNDFISSFAGLKQNIIVKYYRSEDEAINPGLADATGSMISITVPVTVIPNDLGTTNKILPIPIWNGTLGRYVMRYWMYFGDGRSHLDVSGNVTIQSGTVVGDSTYFGVVQTYVIAVQMNDIDPTHYPTPVTYQQNVVIQFNPSTVLVKWTIRDSSTSPYILGQDIVSARRPSIRYDTTRAQYFIPSYIFTNTQAFLNSFYTQASPPYDPTVSQIPQQPTHFTIRNLLTGAMVIASPIPLASYAQAFTIIGDITGQYVGASLGVEFLNVVNSNTTNVLFGVPVDVIAGTYVG